jgi:hypothetical protein
MPGPPRRRPAPPTLSIFPNQVHLGDRFTEADIADEEREWEVVSRPVTFKKGQEVRARVQRPDNPATSREKSWPAFEKITVRRITAAVSPAKAEPEPGDDVEALRKELRRLRGEVARLEDDKRELERRLGFMQREVEQLRAKTPRGISTS